MANNEDFPQSGLVVPADDDPKDKISEFTYPILNDLLYNIIHDICLKTHRDEKIDRAKSAAVIVHEKAKAANPASIDDDEDGCLDGVRQPFNTETQGALYVDGAVFLRGNPLQTTEEIRCPKCKKPRLLHPTDGNGARRPDPTIEYCKKPVFMEKEYYDIYGQIFQAEGPGRGKKKKDMINPLKMQAGKEGTPTGSQDSTPPPNEELKPIQFPSSKCINCNNHIPIRRMNNHMVKCIGSGGRDASRSALLKIQNGNGTNSQNGTPAASRNGTPAPVANGKSRKSPNKRSPADDFDSDTATQTKKKKTTKKTAAGKIKATTMKKSASQLSSSNLNLENKVHASDDEDYGDDDGDGEYGTVVVEPKKKASNAQKKAKEATGSNKRWKIGKGGAAKPILPPLNTTAAKTNGKASESPESSQTLSSPN